jgi:hypothetical protein
MRHAPPPRMPGPEQESAARARELISRAYSPSTTLVFVSLRISRIAWRTSGVR